MSVVFKDFSASFFELLFDRVFLMPDLTEAIKVDQDVRTALLEQYRSISVRQRIRAIATSGIPAAQHMSNVLNSLPQTSQVYEAISRLMRVEMPDMEREISDIIWELTQERGVKTRYDEVADMIFDFVLENSLIPFSPETFRMVFDECYLADEAFSSSLARILVGVDLRLSYQVLYISVRDLCKKDTNVHAFFIRIPEFVF